MASHENLTRSIGRIEGQLNALVDDVGRIRVDVDELQRNANRGVGVLIAAGGMFGVVASLVAWIWEHHK